MTCTLPSFTHCSPARYPREWVEVEDVGLRASRSCNWRPSHDITTTARQNLVAAIRGALARERAREEEAAEWFARWHEASGKGDAWADVEAELAVLARVHLRAWPRGTTIAELRRVGTLLSGDRAFALRGAARGDIELTFAEVPALGWLEAVARLEQAEAIRAAAEASSAAFVALRRGDVGDAVPLLRRALAELAEGLRRQDEARGKALEAMVDEDARRTE